MMLLSGLLRHYHRWYVGRVAITADVIISTVVLLFVVLLLFVVFSAVSYVSVCCCYALILVPIVLTSPIAFILSGSSYTGLHVQGARPNLKKPSEEFEDGTLDRLKVYALFNANTKDISGQILHT